MRANPLPDPWREAAGPRRRAGESGAELAAVRTPAGAPPPESNLAEPLAKEPPDLSTATVTTQAGPEPSDGPHAEQVEQELPRPTRPRKRPPGQRPGAADRHAQPDADGESDRCDQTPKACRADVPAAAEAPLRKSRSASSSSSGSLESSVASLDGTVLAGAPARRDQAAELHRLSGAWSPGAPGSGFGGSPFLSSPLSLPDFALGALTQPAVPPPGSVFARPGFPWHRIGPHEAEMMLKLMGTQRVPTAAFPRACVGASTAARRPPERMPAAADGPIPEGGAVGERQSPCAEGESRATFHFGVARDCGMRQYMEDRHSVVSMFAPHTERRRSTKRGADSSQPSSSFCAVFDGHNGAFAAEKASTRLHDLLASDTALGEWCATREAHVSTAGEVVREGHCPVGSCLERTFLQLDREIIRETRAQNTRDGCTALAILQLGCILWVANAGDCRAVLKRGDFAHRLSNDHKPNIDSEKHRIHVAGGRVEFLGCWRVTHNTLPIALACSRSLGDADFKFPIPLVDATPEVTCRPCLSKWRAGR